jgi:hypothetical protein
MNSAMVIPTTSVTASMSSTMRRTWAVTGLGNNGSALV